MHGRRRVDLEVRRDERDVGAAGGCRKGDRDALLAARAVADEAHGIQWLACSACGHEDATAGEVLGGGEPSKGGFDDVLRLRHPARSCVLAGELADLWT